MAQKEAKVCRSQRWAPELQDLRMALGCDSFCPRNKIILLLSTYYVPGIVAIILEGKISCNSHHNELGSVIIPLNLS